MVNDVRCTALLIKSVLPCLLLSGAHKNTRRASGCVHYRSCSSTIEEKPCPLRTQTHLTHTPAFSPVILNSSSPRYVRHKLLYTKQDAVRVLLLDALETDSDLVEDLTNEGWSGVGFGPAALADVCCFPALDR